MLNYPIEELFKYHPPKTKERIEAHNKINDAALEFAKIVDSTVNDPQCKQMIMFAIQQARMLANQGITIDELSVLNLT